MAPQASTNNILPSSGAIHTTTTETKRTFYYSSLIVDYGSNNVKSRWKVHLGDIVAVAKKNPNQTTLEIIEGWKPNHYIKKSLGWKIGLVVALRKVITRHGVRSGGGGSTTFECHIQWLDKALDLDKAEMKSANLKSVYRPYNTNSKEMGSQLPHVLINCPGQFGNFPMLPTSESNQDYCVLLPVKVTMKTNRDFMKNGIKEKEESREELQFCCTKTRMPQQSSKSGQETSVRSILSERDPDAWVSLNCPSIDANKENGNENSHSPLLLNKIPEPLQRAWKAWLQTSSALDFVTSSDVVGERCVVDEEEKISLLGDALMRGWIQSRRERYNRAVLVREEQRRKMIEEKIESSNRRSIHRDTRSESLVTETVPPKCKQNSSPTELVGTVEKNTNVTGTKCRTKYSESTSNRGKRKEIRFSADTKEPPSKRTVLTKGSKRKSTSREQQGSISRATDGTTKNSDLCLELNTSNRQLKRKMSRNSTIQGVHDDEVASTTTRDTHSTDTTVPTHGAGRKERKKNSKKNRKTTSLQNITNDVYFNGNENECTTQLSTNSGSTSSFNVLDALNQWNLDPSFIQETIPFHITKRKDYRRELRMMIPAIIVRSLLDEDEARTLSPCHPNQSTQIYLDIKVGSIVAIHYNGSISSTNSWTPFRVPWGVAQVTNIFRERNSNDDDDWRLTIKWFYRFPELPFERKTRELESMNIQFGLVETCESCDCSVKEVLPAFIELTSDTDSFSSPPREQKKENDLPIVRMLCQHLERSHGDIVRRLDWNYNHFRFLQSLPVRIQDTLPGPFQRCLEKMPAQLKRRYNEWLHFSSQIKAQSPQKETNPKKETKAFPFEIAPTTTAALYEHSGNAFFDAICLNVRKTYLCKRLHSKCSDRWTLAVGHVIPVHCKNATLGRVKGDGWYPFEKKWCPGQVVAIYKKACGSWMMEIRWFDRYVEILPQHKSSEKHLNRPYVLFETEAYEHLPVSDALPGRVILTSVERNEQWDCGISSVSGLPLIPRLCTRFCFDEEIDDSLDWTDYDLYLPNIPPGLSRGLRLNPRNRQGQKSISLLSEFYVEAIKTRNEDPDHQFLKVFSDEKNRLTQRKDPTCFPYKPEDSKLKLGQHLATIQLEKGSQEFFRTVNVSTSIEYLVSPTLEMKRRKRNSFECIHGDIVCFYDRNASISENCVSKQEEFPWYPFRIPFSYGQVLSIYKESDVDGGNSVKVEIRRFYKSSDLSTNAKEFLPLRREGDCPEIFESNEIEPGINASSLLGTVEVLLGNHKSSGHENRQKNITRCRCRFFFLKTFQKLQPIYWSSVSPEGWDRGLQQRGFQRSTFLQKDDRLKVAMATNRNPESNIEQIYDAFAHPRNLEAEGSCVELRKPIRSSPSHLSFYEEASLHPQWSLFCASDYWSLANCSNRKLWVLEVGDVVAVRDSTAPQNDKLSYPFLAHWFPGQVLAIYNESDKEDDHKGIRFEIRCFKLESSTRAREKNQQRKLTICDPPTIVTVTSTDLLGPLTVYSPGGLCRTDLTKIHIHLPLSEYLATNPLQVDKKSALALSKLCSYDGIREATSTNIGKCHSREHSCQNPVVGAFECSPGQLDNEIKPFRVDALNYRVFYTHLALTSKVENFSSESKDERNAISTMISIGDTVRVRLEGSKRYPYDCNWGVAEVVAIFKELSSHDEFERERNFGQRQCDQNKFQIEIRWFYERSDISMAASSMNVSGFVEVFETDHCQVLDATDSVLDRVKLVEDSMLGKGRSENHFLCSRFWSTKRRSLIPCSGQNGRIRRGLIHSTLGLEQDLDELQLFGKDPNVSNGSFTNWRDSMANLISKLTLKDASKDAYESGKALVGREKELSQLLTFFRAAFLEDHRSEGYKSSMFLAGPPGVGKTATVRAAIARLQQEQKEGMVPSFRFIPLNGIEVRHPSDIYIRFWEALVGRNHVGPQGRACERLEAHFTTKSSKCDFPNDCTTIVLLDEIDYLVTDDQSVLYNLFDWPKRAAEVSSTNRLIVVGISNTLNLVDQLMPSVQSRVGTEKCVFGAYSLNDTTSILKSKIREGSPNFHFFEDDAVLFAAKKTSVLSGDIRKAFQLCRSAAELVTRRFEDAQSTSGVRTKTGDFPKIRISDIQKASLVSFNMAMVTAVSFSSFFEALTLIALAVLRRSTGREVGGFDMKDILVKMEALANSSGNPQYLPAPSFGESIRLLTRLGEMNLVELHTIKSSFRTFRQSDGGSGGAWPMASLAIDELTLLKGLKNTSHKVLAQKNLPSMF